MSEWSNASKKQINYIRKLLRDAVSADNLDVYWDSRKLTPEMLTRGEASNLIVDLYEGRNKQAIQILDHLFKTKSARCTKCGDPIKSDENSLCGNCI